MTKLIVPPGLTEAEEADWWYANLDLVSQEVIRALDEGRIRCGSIVPPSQRAKIEGEAIKESAVILPPKFATEAEETKWWFEHPDVLLAEFEKAEAEDRLQVGVAKRRAKTSTR